LNLFKVHLPQKAQKVEIKTFVPFVFQKKITKNMFTLLTLQNQNHLV